MANKELIKKVLVGEPTPDGTRKEGIKIKLHVQHLGEIQYHLNNLAKQLSEIGLSAEVEIEIG